MCGIFGFTANPTLAIDAQVYRQRLEQGLNTIIHRGPDQDGLWSDRDKGVYLGHRRLSIQDLSEAGRQPMHSHSDRYAIVFNGEIYNFQRLREELLPFAVRYKGGSDTEVLLACIEHFGLEQTLDKLVGMFAFALFDKQQNTLTLVRDRIGEKPLYFGVVAGQLIFASELKPIHSFFQRGLEHNLDALAAYMGVGFISGCDSAYQGIYKLKPGHSLSIGLQQIASTAAGKHYLDYADLSDFIHSYWDIDRQAKLGLENQISDPEQAINELEQQLKLSVEEKLIADVKVGCFLSGGIDSSLVTAMAAAQSDKPIDTFTMAFDSPEFNEGPFAREIANHLGTVHHELRVSTDDLIAIIGSLKQFYDEPFADSSQIPTMAVAAYAKQNVDVVLSGDGGDELFLGYNRYIQLQRIWPYIDKLPKVLRQLGFKLFSKMDYKALDRVYAFLFAKQKQSNVSLKIKKLIYLLGYNDIEQGYEKLMEYHPQPASLLLQPDLYSNAYSERLSNLASDEFELQRQLKFQAADQTLYLPDDNLVKVDRATMATSIEARVPLLDHRVLELSWRFPADIKLRDNKSKWPLRQLLYRYVPAALIDRPKMGFSVPMKDWLRGEIKDWGGDLISANKVDPLLDMRKIEQLWREHQAGQDHANILWTVLMYLNWKA